MAKIETSKTRMTRAVYSVLLLVTGVLAALLAIGTIIGLVRNKDTPLVTLGRPAETQVADTSKLTDDIRVFSGIGRLRIPLANSSVLILSIAFPYQASDIAFTEELAGKLPEFKTIAADYFSTLPESEIIQINEEAAKAEILSRYNGALRLGRISALYFNDMMILDVR